jgi:hypothetical protein
VCALKRRSGPEVENPAAGPTAVIGHPAAEMVTMDMKVLTLFTVRAAQAVRVNQGHKPFQVAVGSAAVDRRGAHGFSRFKCGDKAPLSMQSKFALKKGQESGKNLKKQKFNAQS